MGRAASLPTAERITHLKVAQALIDLELRPN